MMIWCYFGAADSLDSLVMLFVCCVVFGGLMEVVLHQVVPGILFQTVAYQC